MIRRALTTFAPQAWDIYGKRFVESFVGHWPIPLHVFHQNERPDFDHWQVTWHNLHDDPDYRSFIADFENDDYANGWRDDRIDYRFQAVKFCHKVFAQTSPMFREERRDGFRALDQWIWIDADVETHHPIDELFWAGACPAGVVASYLGRKDWHHSECGFMCYNLPQADTFLTEFRRLYVDRRLFTLREWHDSFAWDHVRHEVGGRFHNLSDGVSGLHVWPRTILGRYMEHRKGPRAKLEAYGQAI